MSDSGKPRIQAFGDVKEKALERFTNAYVKNLISMDEFEEKARTIENASKVEEITELVSRLAELEPEGESIENPISVRETVKCHGSSKTLARSILETRSLEMDLAHSALLLDYSQTSLPAGSYGLVVKMMHSSCKIIIPEGMTVENRAEEMFSSIKDKSNTSSFGRARITLRISGSLAHSSIKIVSPKRRSLFGWKQPES